MERHSAVHLCKTDNCLHVNQKIEPTFCFLDSKLSLFLDWNIQAFSSFNFDTRTRSSESPHLTHAVCVIPFCYVVSVFYQICVLVWPVLSYSRGGLLFVFVGVSSRCKFLPSRLLIFLWFYIFLSSPFKAFNQRCSGLLQDSYFLSSVLWCNYFSTNNPFFKIYFTDFGSVLHDWIHFQVEETHTVHAVVREPQSFSLWINCVLLLVLSYYNTKAVFLALGITAVVCIAVTVFCFQTKVGCVRAHLSVSNGRCVFFCSHMSVNKAAAAGLSF